MIALDPLTKYFFSHLIINHQKQYQSSQKYPPSPSYSTEHQTQSLQSQDNHKSQNKTYIEQQNFDSMLQAQSSGQRRSPVTSKVQIDKLGEMKEYFLKCIKDNSKYEEYKQRLTKQIALKIKNQIKNGTIFIADQPKQIKFQIKQPAACEDDIKRDLQTKKQEIISRLKQIQNQQFKLIQRRKISQGKLHSLKKLQITQQDKIKLIQLLKSKKNFEKDLIKKDQQLIQKAKLKRKQEDKLKLIGFQMQNQKKKIKILQNLKQIELKTQQRQQVLKNSRLKQGRGYIYKQKEKQWKLYQNQRQQSIKRTLAQLSKQHQLKIVQINQHDKRYSIELKKRSEESKQKHRIVSISLPKREKTFYDRIVEQQIFQTRQRNYEKNMKIKQNQLKKKIYMFQEKIDQNYRPKIDPSQSFILPIERTYSSVSLTKQKRVQKGLQYLEQAKKMKRGNSKSEPNIEVKQLVGGYSMYKDYLKDREPINFNPTQKELTSILAKSKLVNNYEQLQRAKYLAEGLSAKFKKNIDNKMYHSMKTKMLLLDSLY